MTSLPGLAYLFCLEQFFPESTGVAPAGGRSTGFSAESGRHSMMTAAIGHLHQAKIRRLRWQQNNPQ